MLLYAVTNRLLLADNEAQRRAKLVALAADWAAAGVDFIQVREKDLPGAELVRLAAEIVLATRQPGGSTRVLLNLGDALDAEPVIQSRADGIHLSGGRTEPELSASLAGFRARCFPGSGRKPVASISCHSVAEVEAARRARVDVALFAPVFEKALPGQPSLPGHGLLQLAEACRAGRRPAQESDLPVVALGGVTPENTPECLAAGAAGIAGIRLFLASGSAEQPEWWRAGSRSPGGHSH